jgi:hypothetical protein
MTQHSFHARTEFDTIASGRGWPEASASRLKRILGLISIGLLLLLTGCGPVTVFQSSFSANAVGAPPSYNQATGTIIVVGVAGTVVITSPLPNVTGNWVQLQRAAGPGVPISSMLCNVSQPQPSASYSLLAVLYIPNAKDLPPGSDLVASVGFNSVGQSTEFLHLDFMQNNTVRINDSATAFGTFPRGQFFTLSVTLDVGSTTATAHMSLLGTGALGSYDYDVTPLALAAQFGAVNFYVGNPWSGWFKVNSVLVTRK